MKVVQSRTTKQLPAALMNNLSAQFSAVASQVGRQVGR